MQFTCSLTYTNFIDDYINFLVKSSVYKDIFDNAE